MYIDDIKASTKCEVNGVDGFGISIFISTSSHKCQLFYLELLFIESVL